MRAAVCYLIFVIGLAAVGGVAVALSLPRRIDWEDEP
jgi:hypothetical protein